VRANTQVEHVTPSANLTVVTATGSTPGPQRSVNEDRVLVGRRSGDASAPLVLAVADGMGGHDGGATASEAAINAVVLSQENWDTDRGDWFERLTGLFALAQRCVAERASSPHGPRPMGSTLTAVVIDRRSVVFGHAGDSRFYVFRAGRLRQMTSDHTVAHDLLARGDITPEDAAVHAGKSILTRAITSADPVEPEQGHIDLVVGDLLLLVTDGVHGALADADIVAELASVDAGALPSLQRAVDRLLTAVREKSGKDDASIVLAGVTR